MLVATTGQKGKKPPTEEATDHFEKLLEAPMSEPPLSGPTRLYKDYGLQRKFLSKGTSPEMGQTLAEWQERESGSCFAR